MEKAEDVLTVSIKKNQFKTPMKKTLLAFLLTSAIHILLISYSKAENTVSDPKGGTISGRIVDASSNQPMEYVSVALFRATDSTLVTGAISNPEGKFKLDKISTGAYYLKISFLGFQNLQTDKIVISGK